MKINASKQTIIPITQCKTRSDIKKHEKLESKFSKLIKNVKNIFIQYLPRIKNTLLLSKNSRSFSLKQSNASKPTSPQRYTKIDHDAPCNAMGHIIQPKQSAEKISETINKNKEFINESAKNFNLIEVVKKDPTYAFQTLESRNAALYGHEKDQFLKKLAEHSTRQQNKYLNDIDSTIRSVYQQALKIPTTSKDTNLNPMNQRIIRDVAIFGYNEGKKEPSIDQIRKTTAITDIACEIENVGQNVLKYGLIDNELNKTFKNQDLMHIAQAAFIKGRCDTIKNAYVRDLVKTMGQMGMNTKKSDNGAYEVSGEGADAFRAELMRSMIAHSSILDLEVKEQTLKHFETVIEKEIMGLKTWINDNIATWAHSQFDDNPTLKAKLMTLSSIPSSDVMTSLANISTHYKTFMAN